MKFYAITLSKTRYPNTISWYEERFESLFELLSEDASLEWHYEKDKGLHAHAMVSTSKKLYINDIRKLLGKYGYSIEYRDLEEQKDQLDWLSYIRKSCHLERTLVADEKREEEMYGLAKESGASTKELKESKLCLCHA